MLMKFGSIGSILCPNDRTSRLHC